MHLSSDHSLPSPGIESQGHRSWSRVRVRSMVGKDGNAVGQTSILHGG